MIPLMLSFLGGCAVNAEQAPPREAGELTSAAAARVEIVVLETADAKLELDLPGAGGGGRAAHHAAAHGGDGEPGFVGAGAGGSEGAVRADVDAA
ncbi:MAG: hypothetical protein AAGA48_40570, partial [Myxococcota bacterium]